MKRQAISISLSECKQIMKMIEKELKECKKLCPGLIRKRKDNVRCQFNIINYPTKSGKRTFYCSDTWIFECLRTKK